MLEPITPALPSDYHHTPVGLLGHAPPLSGDVDEIIEYMRFIGERRSRARD